MGFNSGFKGLITPQLTFYKECQKKNKNQSIIQNKYHKQQQISEYTAEEG